MPIFEQGMNELGDPICCEVCAMAGTADDVCESTCKNDLCSRARDVHAMVGQQLNGLSACNLLDCGFSFEACMDTNSLHVQGIITNNDLPQFYGLQAECHAHANEPVRADGLFSYLEDLNGVPGANGPLADEEDVVGYCLGLEGGAATGATAATGGTTPPANDGAESTGGTGGDTDTGEAPGPGQAVPPQPCGPFARERFWVRPTNNFGAWDEIEGGVLGVDAATQAARVTNGGISYTIFPCSGAPNAECIRIDRLSVELTEAGSGLVMHLSMLDDPGLMPITDQGQFDIPPGSLRFRVRHQRAEHQEALSTRNTGAVRGSIDTRARTIRVEELDLASDQGEPVVTSTLEARLTNIQPKARIVESRDARSGRPVFTAESFDADGDPLVHHWTIPGVGSWRGNAISPPSAPGRYAVILYADDEHRARGVAARWLEVRPSGVP